MGPVCCCIDRILNDGMMINGSEEGAGADFAYFNSEVLDENIELVVDDLRW